MRWRLFLLAFVAAASPCLARVYPIQGTFLNFYRDLTPELWKLEFQYMKDVDIDTVVVLSVGHLRPDSNDASGYSLAPDGCLYPSRYLMGRYPTASDRPSNDRLEMVLSLADHQRMKVYVGSLQTATDWTDGREFAALRAYNRLVAAEIRERYGHHPSFQGWYFTQELWMNWMKYYGHAYYGTGQLANWAADMRSIDSTKLTAATVVVKATSQGSMPGLTASELRTWTTSLVRTTKLDILMPQDGAGAGAGAPSIGDLPDYFAAMAAGVRAGATKTSLWSIVETFTADCSPSGERYPPANISRIRSQISQVRPYVTGYVSWIFGDDLSPQARYYPAEARELNRQYKLSFGPVGSHERSGL
jgi:hypothetical protein